MAINTTSFTNTPQAGDDLLLSSKTGLNEESFNIVYLDVMSNDLGGNAKTLYSLDNGIEDDGKTGADLLIQDTAKTESLSTDTSLNGAKIWISNGKVGYDASTLSADFQAKLQHLAQGESLTDSFTYAIRLGNGTLSWATATVQIAGKNDAVTITLADTTGAVVEDAGLTPDSNDSQTATGSISFKDIDFSDTHTATFVKSDGHESRLGTFSLTPVVEAANAETGSVAWTYTLNNADAQYLAEGQTVTEVYTVKINDGHGSTATQKVSITITGTNDAVNIRSGVQAGTVTEDGALSAGTSDDDHESTEHDDHDDDHDEHDEHESDEHQPQPQQSAHGVIKFTDADQSDTHTATVNNNGVSALGTLTLQVHEERGDDDGEASHGSVAWTYTLNNDAAQSLAAGEQVTEVFEVTVSDGHGSTKTETVTITVNGTNDAPVVTNAESQLIGSVKEDDSLIISGQLSASDVDHGASQTWSVQNSAVGTYGSIAVDAATGQWTYTLNNNADNVQTLAVGESHDETFTIRVDDGLGGIVDQTVTITVNGTNDAAVLSSATADLIETNEVLSTSGTLTISDIDSAATFVAQVDQAGLYGTFNIGTDGAWTYVANSAHDEFAEGITYTDTFAVTSADGTATSVTVNILGTNDAAVLSSAAVVLDETNAALSTSGVLSISDVDNAAQFIAQDAAPGSNGLFSIDADGNWSYTANSAFDNLNAGDSISDTFIVKAVDGTETSVKVTINGTNDAAVLSSAIVALDETNAALSTSGVLSISDVDNAAQFIAQDAAPGSNGLFSIDADGNWSYTANSAFDNLNVGDSISDTFIVKAIDGTETSVKVTVNGTNDAAVLSSATVNLTETNAALTTSGTLTISDVDSAPVFVAQTNVVGSYGTFNIGTDGAWTYVAGSAHNEFVAGTTYTDTFAVTSADGTATSVKVNILGTNDAAVLSTATANLTETNVALTTSGTLTISDVDSAATFVARTGVSGSYGTFNIGSNGAWTYATNGAHNEFTAGITYTDTFAVTSADGTATSVKINILGTNDAPVLLDAITTFEEVSFNGGWGSTSALNLSGGLWHTDNPGNRLEIGAGTIYGAGTTSQVNELEANGGDPSNLYTDINAVAGTSYAVSFDYSPRAGVQSSSNVSVFWGGNLVGHLSGSTTGMQHFSLNLPVPADGTYRLEFRADDHSGAGGLLDNIAIQHDGAVNATVIEQVTPAGNLSASGSLWFTDLDMNDVHLVSATGTPLNGVLGSLTAVKNTESTSTGNAGKLTWTYTVADAAVEYLAAGQTKVESFTITLDDQHGGIITKQINVTVAGTNDAPVVAALDVTGVVTEIVSAAGSLSDSGIITFTDADLADVHSLSAVTPSAGALGTLTASVSTDTTGSGTGGAVTWNYSVAASAVEYLAAGQTKIETFTFNVQDGHGGSIPRTVSVTVTGTNDAPVVAAVDVTGAVTEMVTAAGNLSDSGIITFTDADLSDIHSLSAVTPSAGALGTLTASVSTDTTGSGTGGAVTWNYSVAASAVEYLAAGQTKVETFSFNVLDGHGGSVPRTVSVTVTGTNDAPIAHNDTNALTVASLSSITQTNVVNWVDWTSSAQGKVYGTLNIGNGQTIDVTYSGEYAFAQTNGGTNFYTAPAGTYTSSAVANGPTGSDIIALSQASQKTLTFSQPVNDLFFAVVSLNGNGYLFDQDFRVASYGPGYWGSGSATRIALADGRFEVVGNGELHGVLQIDGAVQSLTWTSQTAEYWNGFTIGSYGKAQSATVSGNVLANDSDPDTTDTLAVSAVNDQLISGNSITLNLASGARVTVNKDGSYLYDENSAFGSLAQNQTTQDSFQYTVSDGHGGVSTATASITITGSNEAPVIQLISTDTATTTLTETNAGLAASGTLTVTDVDLIDTVSSTVTGVTLTGTSGGLIADNVLNMLSVSPASNLSANTGDAHNLSWIFNSGNQDFNYLAPGQSLTLTYTLQSTDNNGASATQNVVVTINGTNDAAVITGTSSGTVAEAGGSSSGTPSVSGDLLATDPDNSADSFQAVSTSTASANGYGTYTLTANGVWTYTLNNSNPTVNALNTGASLTDSFTVYSTDGTAKTVAITINGTTDNNSILFVDDDRGLNGQGTWLQTLSNLGFNVTYEAISADGNPTSNLSSYAAVIWSIGDQAYTNLTAQNVSTLTSYLNSGGKLLYAGGHNLYSEPNATAFAANYLGVSNYNGNMPGTPTTATGPGGSYTLNTWAGGYYGGTMMSGFSAASSATQVLMTLNGVNHLAVVNSQNGFSAATWGFDINQLGATYQKAFLNATLTAMGISNVAPAGISSEAIHLGLTDPTVDSNDLITLTVTGLPSNWTLNNGTLNLDGTWTVQTNDPSNLTVTTDSGFTGAVALQVTESWVNEDGSTGTVSINDNVEAYTAGAPIFAWSGDDNLTGSAGADLFALGQPTGNVTVFNFDASADKIDLMGFAGITSFADVQRNLSVDADGNALITLADGQTIMLKGIDPAALSADDFVFNETPITHNTGNMIVGDGAMLPLGGIIDNSGSIALQSTGDATKIELIMGDVSLQGHGHVTLTDNDNNIIFGATSNTSLTNVDNIISGAGQLGQGQLILNNQGIIVADGTHALTIDTGANAVINSGTLESTGTGGLIINSAVSNSGLLWAHGGDLIVNGAVNSGSVLIDNGGDIEFGDASSANVSFGAGSSNILKLDDAGQFTGSVSNLDAGDAIDLDNFSSDNATMSYADNADHSGGTLSITNGAHEVVNITLVGQYLDSGFALAADGSAGTMISYQ